MIFRKQKVAIAVVIVLMLAGLTASCALITATDPRLRASGLTSFSPDRYRSFQDYVRQTRAHLEEKKVFHDDAQAEKELWVAAPFELPPAAGCPAAAQSSARRGILLLHGLSDMPFAMRDLAEAFSQRCFLVRALLLPGHGARPGDLLAVHRRDWAQATRFALETLKRETDRVYVGGFSLGGLLAVQAAIEDPDLKGVFAFSPALALNQEWKLSTTAWLRHLVAWADVDRGYDYARFEAMPLNALAETYLLSQDVRAALRVGRLSAPLFLVQSEDDRTIDTKTNRLLFEKFATSPDSRLLIYRQNTHPRTGDEDARVSFINSYLPDRKISGFSHISLHFSPANPHYGLDGDFRSCGEDTDRNAEDVKRCQTEKTPWRGELIGDSSMRHKAGEAAARLTFNPLFKDLLGRIDEFLEPSSN